MTSSLTPSALVSIDYNLDNRTDYGMSTEARQVLVERGEKLAAEFLSALAAQPGISNVQVIRDEAVRFTYQKLTYTWRINVYRSERGMRHQDAWSIGFNMPTRRSSVARERDLSQRAFYGRDGKDAKAETAAAWLVKNVDASYAQDVIEAQERSEHQARVKHAEAVTAAHDGIEVTAPDEGGFVAAFAFGDKDADKIAKMIAFYNTL